MHIAFSKLTIAIQVAIFKSEVTRLADPFPAITYHFNNNVYSSVIIVKISVIIVKILPSA